MAVRTRGFTLAEVMIVVAIAGIVMMLGPEMFSQVNRVYYQNKSRVELQRDSRGAMSLMNRYLRQAKTSSLIIDQVTGQPYYSRVKFTILDGTSMTFYQSGSKLIMTSGTQTKTLSENLRYLAFALPKTDDLTLLSVGLTLEKYTYEGKIKALHMASEKVRIMND